MREKQEQTILVVSDDVALCAATRREFEFKGSLRVAPVSTVDAARSVVADAAPAVILLDETALAAEPGCKDGTSDLQLSAVVSDLILRAPVVVIGEARSEAELAAFVDAGGQFCDSRKGLPTLGSAMCGRAVAPRTEALGAAASRHGEQRR